MADKEIKISIVGEDKGFTKATQNADKSLQSLESRINKGTSAALDQFQGKLGKAGGLLSNFGVDANTLGPALSKAQAGISGAEGAFGKLGAAASGAGGVLAALPLPVVAGAAVAAGGALIKLGNEFTNTALEAKKLSSAAGLSVEQASEWIAAGDDIGVSADLMAAAFGRATKSLGATPEKFEALGISIVHAKDGTIDMKETLLGAIDVINGIEDPTKKAAVASALFGKAWQTMTPILERGSAELRETMAATSEAQRITDEEVVSAKKWQATMDDLGDTVVDLKLSLGKLVVDGMGPTLRAAADMSGQFDTLINTIDGGAGGIQQIGDLFGMWVEWLSPVGMSLKAVQSGIEDVTIAAEALAGPFKAIGNFASDAFDAYNDFAGGLDDALGPVGDAIGSIESGIGDGVGAVVDFFGGGEDAAVAFSEAVSSGAVAGDQSMTKLGAAMIAANDGSRTMAAGQKEAAASLKETSAAANAQAAAMDRATQSMMAQQNAALGAINSELGYRQAVSDVDDALSDLTTAQQGVTDATNKSGAASTEAAEANKTLEGAGYKVEESILSAAAAASKYAQDQAEARGQTFTANDSINAQIGALEALKQKFPGLAGVIDGFIGKLNAIPASKEVEIQAHAAGLDAIIDKYNQIKSKSITVDVHGGVHVGGAGAATGGPRSGLVWVGEEGPELVNLPAGSYVNTAPKSKKMAAAMGAPHYAEGGYVLSDDEARVKDAQVKAELDRLRYLEEQYRALTARTVPTGTESPVYQSGASGASSSTPSTMGPVAAAAPMGAWADAVYRNVPTDNSWRMGATYGAAMPSTMTGSGMTYAPVARQDTSSRMGSTYGTQSPSTMTASGTTYVTVNMPPGSDGEDVVRALKRYERRNGAVPIRTL